MKAETFPGARRRLRKMAREAKQERKMLGPLILMAMAGLVPSERLLETIWRKR